MGRKIAAKVLAARLRLFGRRAPIPLRLRPDGPDRWRNTGADPQFLFAAPGSAPTTLTLFLDARPVFVRPRIYFDWGDGFREGEDPDAAEAQALLIRIPFSDTRGLRGIRFDPAEDHARFRFRFQFANHAGAIFEEARRDFEAARAAGAAVVEMDVNPLDCAPALGERPIGLKRRPRDAHERYLRIGEVARRELLGTAPRPDAAPLISFVTPVYNTPAKYLDDLLRSFRAQAEGLSELVLSDDGSTSVETDAWLRARADERGVVIIRRRENKGIAATSNEGVGAARGRWIGLVDHDDALAPHAAALLASALNEHPGAKFIYTDELIADRHLRGVEFFHKPAFDDVLLSGVNYINHLSLYRRDRLAAIGGFRDGFDGSQDYDLLLRYLADLSPAEILHLPYPAYIWRRDGASYSVKFLEKATVNARRALGEAYGAEVRPAINADLHRVWLELGAPRPKVSIVIPSRDAFPLISRLIDGLIAKTDYPDFDIIVVDNGSTDPDVLALYERLGRELPNFTLLMETAEFNVSRQVNVGMARASGDLILLLDNDIEIIEPGWLGEMASCFRYPRTGVVGARLLYPNRTLRHAGVIVGFNGLAGHWFNGRPADWPGPMARLNVRASMSAVTSACMMISRPCMAQVGPFDEMNFAVAYNDVDYCLRAREFGWRTLYTPFATLIHHESASRGPDDRGPNRARLLRDQAALIERHGTEDFQDPFFSPWFDRERSEPSYVSLDKLPAAR